VSHEDINSDPASARQLDTSQPSASPWTRSTGTSQRSPKDQTTRQAAKIVADQTALVDLWLKYRMATLAARPEQVRRAALQERGRS
jgi:hypothetical protein